MDKKSQHDIDKENHEEEILNQAIKISKTKRKLTRDILSFMDGTPIKREKNDRPDIVRIVSPGKISEEETLIGIEHFLVEQVSTGQKRESFINIRRRYIEKLIIEKGNCKDDPIEYQKLREAAANVSFDIAANANATGIPELKDTFCFVLEKHIAKIHDYCEKLKELANGKPYKLAFLIEIHCKTDDDFLNNGRTVVRKYNDTYPVFNWMVEELEKIDCNVVDYVVLFFRHSIHEDVEDVVAVETKDIRGSLRKQGIIAYHYCDNPDKTTFNKLGMTDTGLQYNIEMENKNTYIQDMEPILRQAYEYKKRGIPYVAPRAIQEFQYALGDRYIGNNLAEIIYTPETLVRFVQFVQKYPLEKLVEELD